MPNEPQNLANTDIIPKAVPQEANFVHNWLYSVVPASTTDEGYTVSNDPLSIYLAGFCVYCRKGFSTAIPHGQGYIETQLEVPVYGCVEPGLYR